MRTRAGASLLLTATVLAGCGYGTRLSPPSGVDGLVVPTPSPDAADFVAAVDNPWFPLADGAQWTYDLADGTTRTVLVSGTVAIAGIETTAVQTADGAGTRFDYYAQDADGNVWHFGHEGDAGETWQAGLDGAEAGLWVTAVPRVGDGYETGPDERAEVVDLGEDDLTLDLDPGGQVTLRRDVGLVASDGVSLAD